MFTISNNAFVRNKTCEGKRKERFKIHEMTCVQQRDKQKLQTSTRIAKQAYLKCQLVPSRKCAVAQEGPHPLPPY